jgi:hypothetical protein
VDSITRFSLLKLYHEEPFESHNTPLRNASLFSNRQAPSKHIGHKQEKIQQMRHLLSGGFCLSTGTNGRLTAIRAAPAILMFMAKSKALQRVYGILPAPSVDIGMSCIWVIEIFILTSPQKKVSAM